MQVKARPEQANRPWDLMYYHYTSMVRRVEEEVDEQSAPLALE